MVFKFLGIFFFLLLFCFLVGCSEPLIRQGNITKAVIGIDIPENFVGVGKNLEKNTSAKNATLGLKYSSSDEMKMRGVKNKELYASDYEALGLSEEYDYMVLPETKIEDFYYKRNRFPVSASYTYLKKYNTLVHAFSLGIDPSVYARHILGINTEGYELGSFLDLGFNVFSKNSVDFYECSLVSENDCGENYVIKHLDPEGYARIGLGLYFSLFINDRIAFSYAPSAHSVGPFWEVDDYEGRGDLRFRVRAPSFLDQYVGLSMWLDNHWKVSMGTTILSSFKFDSFYWTANVSAGYWF